MIKITKDESVLVREKFPAVHITMTCRNKHHGRKRYYMEEDRRAVRFIQQYRHNLGRPVD